MKLILSLSLLLNLGLAGTGFYLQNRRLEVHSQAPVPGTAIVSTNAPSAVVAAKKSSPGSPIIRKRAPVQPVPAAQKFDWTQIESPDYKVYVANLRAIGCPEETIQDIIVADLNELYSAKARKTIKEFKFWEASSGFIPGFDAETMDRNLEIENEKKQLLEDLLGHAIADKPNLFTAMGGTKMIEAMLGFLPPEKIEKIMSFDTDADPKKYEGKSAREIEKMRNDRLAEVLTPEEMREYELRVSSTATKMRMELGSFSPTKEEFLAIFDLRKKYDEEFGAGNMIAFGPSEPADGKAAETKKELDEKIKQTLGSERFAEYQLSQDQDYRSLVRLTEKNQLPRQSTLKLHEMVKAYDTERDRIFANNQFSDEQKARAEQAIRLETQRGVQSLIGDKGVEAVKKTQVGQRLFR